MWLLYLLFYIARSWVRTIYFQTFLERTSILNMITFNDNLSMIISNSAF